MSTKLPDQPTKDEAHSVECPICYADAREYCSDTNGDECEIHPERFVAGRAWHANAIEEGRKRLLADRAERKAKHLGRETHAEIECTACSGTGRVRAEA